MSVPIPLDDIWQRFNWGDAEGQALDRWQRAFVDESPYTSHVHKDGDRWKWDFLTLISEREESEAFAEGARLVGHFLDHMRAALNYLTYQLALHILAESPALQGRLNPEAVEFPIFDDHTVFQQKNRIKQFPSKYFAPIESVQPYHRSNPGLWRLHELAREYRHRVIHPIACYPFGEFDGFTGALPDFATDIDRPYQGGPLKSGDPLFSFSSNQGFNPDDYPNLVLGIGIDHSLCYGLSAVASLGDIAREVGDVLTDWSNEPWPPPPRAHIAIPPSSPSEAGE